MSATVATGQWFSKCGPQISNTSFTWELVRNTISLAQLRPITSETKSETQQSGI